MGGYVIMYGNIQTSTSRLFKGKVGKGKGAGQGAGKGAEGSEGSDRSDVSGGGPPTGRSVPKWAAANSVQVVVQSVGVRACVCVHVLVRAASMCVRRRSERVFFLP